MRKGRPCGRSDVPRPLVVLWALSVGLSVLVAEHGCAAALSRALARQCPAVIEEDVDLVPAPPLALFPPADSTTIGWASSVPTGCDSVMVSPAGGSLRRAGVLDAQPGAGAGLVSEPIALSLAQWRCAAGWDSCLGCG